MPHGGPGEGRTRINVNIAEVSRARLAAETTRVGALLHLPRLTISHCVRGAIEHFLREPEDVRTAIVARWGGDGEPEAGTAPPPDRL